VREFECPIDVLGDGFLMADPAFDPRNRGAKGGEVMTQSKWLSGRLFRTL